MLLAALLSINVVPGMVFLARRAESGMAGPDQASDEQEGTRKKEPWRLLPLWLLGSFLAVDRVIAYSATDTSCAAPSAEADMSHLLLAAMYATFLLTSLVSALLSYAFMGQRNRSTSTIVTSLVIETMMVVTYFQMYRHVGSSRGILRTWWGGHFYAARINLWCHSSLTQVVVYASAESVTARFGVERILRRLVATYVMFSCGLVSTLPPPSLGAPILEGAWTLLWLIASGFFFSTILSFIHEVLPLAIVAPGAEANETATPLRAHLMGWMRGIILCSWTSVPIIWGLTALHILSHNQESLAYAVGDGIAKGFTSLILHFGATAAAELQAHVQQMHALSSKETMLVALKEFTQSIGHDLRTPLQEGVLIRKAS